VRGDAVYNFWQDEDHVKGIWRRTTMEASLGDCRTSQSSLLLWAINLSTLSASVVALYHR